MVARAATHVRGTVCLDTKRGKLRLYRFMDELVRILTLPLARVVGLRFGDTWFCFARAGRGQFWVYEPTSIARDGDLRGKLLVGGPS